MIRRSGLAALTTAIIFCFLSPALSANTCRDGTFLIFSGHSLDFRRDLASDLTLWHFEKAFYVPHLNRGWALAVGIGGKSYGGTWDVSYLHSSQSVSYQDGVRTAVFQALEISGRSFFLKKLFLHPYFLGGISIPFIHVRDGASYQGEALNASYFGAGLSVGTGVMLEIGPSLLLNVGATYRWLAFLYAYGEGKGRDINHLTVGYLGPKLGRVLRTDTLTLTAGLAFVF